MNHENGQEPEELPEKEKPRFLLATERYETYLRSLTPEGEDDGEAQARFFDDLMKRCKNLSGYAQDFEITEEMSELAGTSAQDTCGRLLLNELTRTDIPEEVSGIYWDLYPELAQYFEPQTD